MTKSITRVEVTQADREASGALWSILRNARWCDWQSDWINDGTADNGPLVQAFARHRLAALPIDDASAGWEESFQQRVEPWMQACFGPEISSDRIERNHRFLEEALELVQANGCTHEEAHQLVDYTFNRPSGEPAQEVGGVMVTLAALCLASGLNMHANGETELARIWTKVEQIRAKQAAKPKHSPLPSAPTPPAGASHVE